MGHRIAWFDMPVQDLQRATDFYSKVLQVNIETYGPDVPVAVFEHGPEDVAGCLYLEPEFSPSKGGALLYFPAEGRLEEAVSLVEANGGEVLEEVKSIAPHGFRAVVLDSEGNRIALHSESN